MDSNNNDNQQSFYQFSDQLRVQSSNFSNLSIWGNSFSSKKPEERRNFDIRVGGERERDSQQVQPKGGEFNGFNSGWKIGGGLGVGIGAGVEKNGVNGLNGVNGMNGLNGMNGGNGVFHTKYGSNKSGGGGSNGKKNKKEEELESKTERRKNHNNNSNKKENDKNSVDKRFKTLPATEALPRNEVVGGYIFVCNNDTMEENLKRQLFGLPPRYRDSVRAITPGLPLFLYNYSTHQLHGIFQAASFGGTNIDPTAWEDKKCPGESRFPAQVKVATRKICNPLEEDAFRPILHHYDGPKFRLELNIPEALALLDIFADNST